MIISDIEITRVETLRNNTEAMKSIYPLKLMVAGKIFEIEAVQAGYKSVNEYMIANIFNEIIAMLQGFSTVLTNNGSNLSYGQRQRLALA